MTDSAPAPDRAARRRSNTVSGVAFMVVGIIVALLHFTVSGIILSLGTLILGAAFIVLGLRYLLRRNR